MNIPLRMLVALPVAALVMLGAWTVLPSTDEAPSAISTKADTRGPIVGSTVSFDLEEQYELEQVRVVEYVVWLAGVEVARVEAENAAVAAAVWIAQHQPRRVTSTGTGVPRAPSYDGDGGAAACIRSGEQGAAGYATETGNGFSGAYQFTQSTWNSTALRAGRPDLVGVRPSAAPPSDQDLLFWTLWAGGAGRMNWPVVQARC